MFCVQVEMKGKLTAQEITAYRELARAAGRLRRAQERAEQMRRRRRRELRRNTARRLGADDE